MHSLSHIRLVVTLCIVSLALCIPSFLEVPTITPFIQSGVRKAAAKSVEQLRAQGVWVINVELEEIIKTEDAICFTWEHRYRSKGRIDPPESIQTCIHEETL